METCGCGKDGKYLIKDADGFEQYSCNKYKRCPTYDELFEHNRILTNKLNSCMNKFKVLRKAKEIFDGLG